MADGDLKLEPDKALQDEWSEAERRWADHETTGESISVDEAMDRLDNNLKARFAAKRVAERH